MRFTPALFGIILVAASIGTSLAQSPDASRWELPLAHTRDNGLRGEVLLNGRWDGLLADGKIEPAAVPDFGKKRESYRYSRRFTVPTTWVGRRITVEINGRSTEARVSLNGKPLATLPKGDGIEVDLTAALVEGVEQELMVETEWLGGDVWLRSYPSTAPQLSKSYLTTSFRDQSVQIALEGTAPAGARLQPVVTIFEDAAGMKPVKTIASDSPVIAGAEGHWSATLSAPWTDAQPWSPDSPHLYFYKVSLRDADGKVVDEGLPRRFGFREVWHEGRNIFLNGVPLRFSSDSWNRQFPNSTIQREQAVAVLRLMKRAGFNAIRQVAIPMLCEVADEEGMLIMYAGLGGLDIKVANITSLTKEQAGDAGGDAELVTATDAQYTQSVQRITQMVQDRREHPSIVAWGLRTPWSRVTLDTSKVGLAEDPWKYWPGNEDDAKTESNRQRYLVGDKSAALVRSLDPARPIAAQNQPGTEIEYATRYLCENLDLHERARFFDAWTRSDSQRAIWPSEWSAPFGGDMLLRQQPHQMPQGKAYPSIQLESAARLFGEGVYAELPDETLAKWPKMKHDGHRASPVFQRLVAENMTAIWRAWRTAGVNTIGHWMLREGFLINQGKTPSERLGLSTAEVDPRRPGLARATSDKAHADTFPYPGVDTMLPGGEAYLAGIQPVLAYLGGRPADVNNRDHLFFAGSEIEKSAVVLNDTFHPVEVSGDWALLDPTGQPVNSGTLAATIAPGERAVDQLPIRFTAPEVKDRTAYSLRLQLAAASGEKWTDTFALTVFPKIHAGAPKTKRVTWILADAAEAERARLQPALQRVGAKPLAANQVPGTGDVLIVPRRYLGTPEGVARLKNLGLDERVAAGLNVLVLEQPGPNIFGLRTENVRPRRAFIAASGHPAFAGLQESDLTYWSGSSDLEPDVPEHNTPALKDFPERLWQVSNDNSVATRTLLRPQTGAVRALAVSGFDLAESPLLESAHGKGRTLFCQFDVSNRYGLDPAATRLVDNLLDYLLTVPPADPTRGSITIVAATAPGVEVRPKTFRAAKPAGNAAWGITAAELFFRESIYKSDWITPTLPAGKVAVFADKTAALPAVIRPDNSGKRYETTLNPADFQTGWAKRKIAFIHAALAINQGGSRPDGPSLALQDDKKALYPHLWLNGFVNPYTAACW